MPRLAVEVSTTASVLLDPQLQCAVLIGVLARRALAIHIALRLLESTEPSMLDATRIAAVIMIADPAKVPAAAETTWEVRISPQGRASSTPPAAGTWRHSRTVARFRRP